MTEQEKIRREKLEELKKLGINPYPAELFPVDSLSVDLLKNYKEDTKVIIAGRIMSRRIQGNASFAEIQDSKGRIQVYFNRDTICPDENKDQYNTIFKKLLDLGYILMSDPKFILLDEPAAGVNPRLLETILDRILVLKKQGFKNDEIPIFGEVCVYKRGDYWQFRMWLAKENKYARKSLRTRSETTAIEKGKAAYLESYANL